MQRDVPKFSEEPARLRLFPSRGKLTTRPRWNLLNFIEVLFSLQEYADPPVEIGGAIYATSF